MESEQLQGTPVPPTAEMDPDAATRKVQLRLSSAAYGRAAGATATEQPQISGTTTLSQNAPVTTTLE